MEKQLRKFCQIHALNALFGKNAIQPLDILNFCKDHANTDTGLGAALRGGGTWCPHKGNFADVVINAFLHYHSTPAVRLSSVADKIPIGSTPERFLSGLPVDQNAFMLSWHQGTEPHQGKEYGHAVCVRKHPKTQQWYLLDSERSCPVLLTNHEWRSLKGSVQILAKGSAYSHNSIYGATDEGYTQVIDILEYTTPDRVCITAQSTVGWRKRQQGQVARKQCIDLVGEQDQWGKEKLTKHELNKSRPHEPVSIRPSLLRSALDKVSRPEPAEDKPKLCELAKSRPAQGNLRQIACGKRLFRMESKEGINDIPSRPRREAETLVVGVNAAEETTATVNPVERTEDAHMRKRRRTNPAPDHVPNTKVCHRRPTQTEVPKLVPRKPSARGRLTREPERPLSLVMQTNR